MKKKIKDLTLKECENICDNKIFKKGKGCYNCPLFFNEDFHGKNTCLKEEYIHNILNQEIEVEEDED